MACFVGYEFLSPNPLCPPLGLLIGQQGFREIASEINPVSDEDM